MAVSYPELCIGVETDPQYDFSTYQWKFVILDSQGRAIPSAGAATETLAYVVQNAPRQGQGATVMTAGFTKVVAGAPLPVNTEVILEFVSGSDNGKAIPLPVAAGTYRVRGLVLVPAAAEDDLATIQLVDYYKTV
jgi:hypothetical protein